MRFREHRGTLADSMATVVEVADRAALVAHVENLLGHAADIEVKPYGGVDQRNGWDTYIVTLAGYGVLGFTDGAL